MTIPADHDLHRNYRTGKPDVLKPATRDVPAPGAGDVLIRVEVAGVIALMWRSVPGFTRRHPVHLTCPASKYPEPLPHSARESPVLQLAIRSVP